MIVLKKHRLVVVLALIFVSISAFCQEPNQPKPGLTFEISSEKQSLYDRGEVSDGPIKPTHVAELFLPYSEEYRADSDSQRIMRMLRTSPGRSMSSEQHDFLSTTQAQDAISIIDSGKTVRRHYKIHLYAISEQDARRTAEAFIEALADKAEKIKSYEEHIRDLQSIIFQTKREIFNKEAEAEVTLANLRESIKNVHYLSTDEAKQAISELNKMLNNLDIELAGMKAKMQAIREHRDRQQAIRNQKHEEGINREGILLKLEDMWINLLIELEVAEARKETATQLRMQAEDFCKQMDTKKAEFQKDVNKYKTRVTMYEQEIHRFKEKLARPDVDMLPPKVYQNKVTIYPVHVDE